MTGTLCEAALPDPDGRPGRWEAICINIATQTHRYACVHEHVVERSTCDAHAPVPGDVGCRACWDAGHNCPMTFTAQRRAP